ncbi:MAG: hypothetical protein AJITA_01085 [Acetilactobacillus jinshanensis]
MHDVSRDFLEVYNVGHHHLTNLPKLIRRIRSGMKAKMAPSLKKDQEYIDQSPDFNFKLLLDLMKQSYSDVDSVKQHRHLILTMHTLYGLDEPAMANYIKRATSVTNNQINFNKFKWLIAKRFRVIRVSRRRRGLKLSRVKIWVRMLNYQTKSGG